MANIGHLDEGSGGSTGEPSDPVRCPICATPNEPMRYCRHVRWTFDQGGPLDLAHLAVETSPYIAARLQGAGGIPRAWWEAHGEWVADQVMQRFDARDGYVFGEIAQMDLLARDIWNAYHPEPARPAMTRY